MLRTLLIASCFTLLSSFAFAAEESPSGEATQSSEAQTEESPAETQDQPAESEEDASGDSESKEQEEGTEQEGDAAAEGDADSAAKADASSESTQEASPEPAQEPAEPTEESKKPEEPAEPESGDVVEAAAAQPSAKPAVELGFSGYVRVGYSTLTANRFFGIPMGASDANAPFVGRNDGFVLSDARLNVDAKMGQKLFARIGFDGANVESHSSTAPLGHLAAGVKDAYFGYSLGGSQSISVGRFKPAFDMEGLTSTKDQLFVHRSLESRGVKCHEGFCDAAEGLAPGRQLGVMYRNDLIASLGPLDLGVAAALTNGNSGTDSLNDNDLPAIFGRATLSWGESRYINNDEGPAAYSLPSEGGVFGISFLANRKTYGTAPNRSQDQQYGLELDLAVGYSGFLFQGQAIAIATEHLQATTGAEEMALGGHVTLAYEFLEGLHAAIRVANYNPRQVSSDGSFDSANYDMTTHYTAGVRYKCPDYPVSVVGEFTHAQEDEADEINNDRAEFAVQVTF